MVLSYLRNRSLLPDDFACRLRTWFVFSSSTKNPQIMYVLMYLCRCEQGLRCLDRLPLGIGSQSFRFMCLCILTHCFFQELSDVLYSTKNSRRILLRRPSNTGTILDVR